MKKYHVLMFLILANLFWAGNYMFGKYVVEDMSPLQMTFSRWLIAVFLMFPLAHFIERPNWKLVWREWKILVVMAVLGIIGYNFLLYEALRFTTPMNASLVNSINPALIVLFAFLFLKEKISRTNIIGLAVSLLGVILVLTRGQIQKLLETNYNLGDLLMLAAILVWTVYSIVGRRTKHIPPISATAVSVVFALILLLPFILASGIQLPSQKESLIGIIYMGIFPSVGSFIFWNISVREIGPSKAGVYLNLITVFTAIFSLVMGQSITAVQIIGGILVFTGVYLTSQGRKKNAIAQHETGASHN
ncbi:DMT family transporter [Peribacillus sp. SCS-155]|uniref:DMT family transporter n=1 Tax=Peribacillus sedimenti TaxID=3115297 RepID=UPI003905F56F